MKTVKFIGGNIFHGFNTPYGGTPMTIYCLLKSFEDDEEYKIVAVDRNYFLKDFPSQFKKFIKNTDILHVDDTSILEKMFFNNYKPPDVIGPIARSPLKNYKNGGHTKYKKEWFYKSKIIRLNYAEERKNKDLVNIIRHGVDTEMIKPKYLKEKVGIDDRKYILWAGQKKRYAKNFEMFDKIMKITKLPDPYEFKVMTDYNVCDYWDVLDQTAIVVNTSLYESFCCALFEAKAKGVATIHRKELHGKGVHDRSEIQVDYEPEAYSNAIISLINSRGLIELSGVRNREYVLLCATLKHMRNSIASIYNETEKKI